MTGASSGLTQTGVAVATNANFLCAFTTGTSTINFASSSVSTSTGSNVVYSAAITGVQSVVGSGGTAQATGYNVYYGTTATNPVISLASATTFSAATGNIYAGLWYPVTVAAVTFVVGLLLVRETKDVDLATN